MKKTRWYCDRCGKEFYNASRLTPVEIKSIGQTYAGDYMREKESFVKIVLKKSKNNYCL